VKDFDSFALAGPQKADHIHVHQRHAFHVEDDVSPTAANLRLQFLKVLRSNSANEADNPVLSVRNSFDSQRHDVAGLVSGECKVSATCKRLKPLLVDCTIRARFSAIADFRHRCAAIRGWM